MARVLVPRKQYHLCIDLRAQGLREGPLGSNILFQGTAIIIRPRLWIGDRAGLRNLQYEGILQQEEGGELVILTQPERRMAILLPGLVSERMEENMARIGVDSVKLFTIQALNYYMDLLEGKVRVQLKKGVEGSSGAGIFEEPVYVRDWAKPIEGIKVKARPGKPIGRRKRAVPEEKRPHGGNPFSTP